MDLRLLVLENNAFPEVYFPSRDRPDTNTLDPGNLELISLMTFSIPSYTLSGDPCARSLDHICKRKVVILPSKCEINDLKINLIGALLLIMAMVLEWSGHISSIVTLLQL